MKQVKNENPAFTNMKKLGFGLMRLPKCEDDPKKIDVPQVCEMVDLFMDAAGLFHE